MITDQHLAYVEARQLEGIEAQANHDPSFTLQIPSHWLSAIVNGDESSFDYYEDEEDYAAYQAFCKEEIPTGAVVSLAEESYFSKFHDASPYGVLACDVVDCLISCF